MINVNYKNEVIKRKYFKWLEEAEAIVNQQLILLKNQFRVMKLIQILRILKCLTIIKPLVTKNGLKKRSTKAISFAFQPFMLMLET